MRWCLLRGRAALAAPMGDVDVLIDRRDLPAGIAATVDAGFVRWRSWWSAGQHSFVAHDPSRTMWLMLHVTERLAFGPHHALELDAAGGCLDRRRKDDGVWALSPGDELWVTLLHALLDKGGVADKHRRGLRELVQRHDDDADGPVPVALACAVPGLDAADLLSDVRAGRWDAVEATGRRLGTSWSHRLDSRLRAARNAVALAGHVAAETVTMLGPCVALLASDGAGKSTLAEGLREAFHVPARVVYLGVHGAGGPALARRAPDGIAGAIRAAWLLARRARTRVYRSRRWVAVLDRHPIDALAAPAPSSRLGRTRRAALVAAGPPVDAVVFLDAPAEVLHDRKPEHEVPTLDERRRRYLALAAQLPHAVVVDASAPPDDVRDATVAAVWDRYRARVHPRPKAGDRRVASA